MDLEEIEDLYFSIDNSYSLSQRKSAIEKIEKVISNELIANGETRFWKNLTTTLSEYSHNKKKHSQFISEILRDITEEKKSLSIKKRNKK